MEGEGGGEIRDIVEERGRGVCGRRGMEEREKVNVQWGCGFNGTNSAMTTKILVSN